jgi:hypothetical protein
MTCPPPNAEPLPNRLPAAGTLSTAPTGPVPQPTHGPSGRSNSDGLAPDICGATIRTGTNPAAMCRGFGIPNTRHLCTLSHGHEERFHRCRCGEQWAWNTAGQLQVP